MEEDVRRYVMRFSVGFKREFSIRHFEPDPFNSSRQGYYIMKDGWQYASFEFYPTVEEAEKGFIELLNERGIKEIGDLSKRAYEVAEMITEVKKNGLAKFLVTSSEKK